MIRCRLPIVCENFHRDGRMASAPKKDPKYSAMRSAGLLLAIPTILIVSPLVGFFLGVLADRWLKTRPWLSIVGLVLGFASAGRETYRLWKRAQEEEGDERR
jgi:F0F1-type ATP synthase assembly protein I